MSLGTLAKAYLELLEPSTSGLGSPYATVWFRFNPKEYSVDRSSNWSAKPATADPDGTKSEFLNAQPRSMKLEMFFDGTELRNPVALRRDIALLFTTTVPHPSTIRRPPPSPPFVIFAWGMTRSFVAFVKQLGVKYTMFLPDGTPVRATANLTLEEIPPKALAQNPTSGGAGTLRTHTVVDGDSLQSLAYREYGSPAAWRAIAEANGIDDPLRLPAGSSLLMPAADSPRGPA
jgi:phage tail protein X